jgi:hypothetical protein
MQLLGQTASRGGDNQVLDVGRVHAHHAQSDTGLQSVGVGLELAVERGDVDALDGLQTKYDKFHWLNINKNE